MASYKLELKHSWGPWEEHDYVRKVKQPDGTYRYIYPGDEQEKAKAEGEKRIAEANSKLANRKPAVKPSSASARAQGEKLMSKAASELANRPDRPYVPKHVSESQARAQGEKANAKAASELANRPGASSAGKLTTGTKPQNLSGEAAARAQGEQLMAKAASELAAKNKTSEATESSGEKTDSTSTSSSKKGSGSSKKEASFKSPGKGGSGKSSSEKTAKEKSEKAAKGTAEKSGKSSKEETNKVEPTATTFEKIQSVKKILGLGKNDSVVISENTKGGTTATIYMADGTIASIPVAADGTIDKKNLKVDKKLKSNKIKHSEELRWNPDDGMYLAHHGVKGQQWGERNAEWYPIEDYKKHLERQNKLIKSDKKATIAKGSKLYRISSKTTDVGKDKIYVTSDKKREDYINDGKKRYKQLNEDYIVSQAKKKEREDILKEHASKASLDKIESLKKSGMSDKEIHEKYGYSLATIKLA